MLGGNPRLSEILKSNAKRGGMAGAIFSNDPNIGIRMMGKEAFIPTPLTSIDYHPERTAAVERERKKWYMNTPSFTPSQALQGAKQGYPDEPTRGDVEDTMPVPPKAVPPKPVVAPPAEKNAEPKAADKPSQLDDKKDPMFESWAKDLPSLYGMFTDDEIAKHVDETRLNFGENDVWYKTAKQYGDAEMRKRRPPVVPPSIARPAPEQPKPAPQVPETIARPSDFIGPTGQSVSSLYDFEKPRDVSQQLYDRLSEHGPAYELLSPEERKYLMEQQERKVNAMRVRRDEADIASAQARKRDQAEMAMRDFLRRNFGINTMPGRSSEYEPLYDRSLAGSVANSELSGKQEFDNFKTALNSPIQNFREYYPMISELLGAFGDAGRALNNLPQNLNRALSSR
jgi:hypothetical protein